jgi:hypothetical protein
MLDVLWMILMMPEMPAPNPGAPLGVKDPPQPSRRVEARRGRARPARRKALPASPEGTRRAATARPG